MKKLCKKATVHPTPPFILDQLSLLPAAIFTLTVALSPNDREVLAYLLSSSSSNNYSNTNNINNKKNKNTISSRGCYFHGIDHATSFNCSCFRCYLSFWMRWDSSPNRQLIHEIIDAFEDGLPQPEKKEKGKKERRRKSNRHKLHNDDKGVVQPGELSPVMSELRLVKTEFCESNSVESCIVGPGEIARPSIYKPSCEIARPSIYKPSGQEVSDTCERRTNSLNKEEEELVLEKGSIRRFVGFVGEKIWSVWT